LKTVCKRCVLDSTIPNVIFDESGQCNYCTLHDELENKYPLDGSKDEEIQLLMNKIRKDGKGKEYDCVVGLSGGCDSSYMLYLLKEKYNLRPLAITFDNTWSTTIAVENILNMTEKLDVDLHTYVIDGKEFNDICRSFLYASTPDADVPTDIAIAKLFYMAMDEFDINYSFCGHSFRSEGTVPLGWTYMDAKYIRSVHEKFGTIEAKTYPNLEVEYWIEQLQKENRVDRIRDNWGDAK
jgi:7-cyano-7-deazaguanine synthase in queuosine biosynthesis